MISVIVPALDEERRLPRCLEAVVPPARRVGAEVIVVDGGSLDATCEVARKAGARVLSSPPGRGRQMNAGARAARGSLLLFLPADTILPEGALDALVCIDAAGCPEAGGFRHRFDRDGFVLRLVSMAHTLRSAVTGVFYGDQAPFVRSALFERAGGFPEDAPMEDVEFGARLRRLTRTRLLDLTVTTSARRFERFGPLRATGTAAVLLAARALTGRVPRSETFFSRVREEG